MLSTIDLLMTVCLAVAPSFCEELRIPTGEHIRTLDQCERQALVVLPGIMAKYPDFRLAKFHCENRGEDI